MNFFVNIKSLDDLKSQYRKLALKHHPDCGGDLATMQTINVQYDKLHLIWNSRKASDADYESAEQYRTGVYYEQGWKGDNYNSDLRAKQVAALFRAYVKKHWPQCRFSVTSTYNTLRIALLSAPFSPWADLQNPETACQAKLRKLNNPYYDAEEIISSGQMNVNHHNIEDVFLLSPAGKILFKDICMFVQSYNFDHSDILSDYFHVNFYLSLAIGSGNKPFVQKGNTPISESKEISKAA